MALIVKTSEIPIIPPGIGTPLKSLRSRQVLELDETISTNPFAWLWIEVRKGVMQHMSVFNKSGGRVLRPQDLPAA